MIGFTVLMEVLRIVEDITSCFFTTLCVGIVIAARIPYATNAATMYARDADRDTWPTLGLDGTALSAEIPSVLTVQGME